MSLFGAKPASSATPGTGFGFGAAASASPATKPLFGSTTSSTPSLFGSTAPATSTTGSLFGSPATSAAGGGLFGKPAASVPPTTCGLFASTASSTGGLFGSTTTSTSGGLFGKPSTGFGTSTTTSSGGLFGSKPAGGGLFSTSAAQGAAPATRQRETLHGLISNADATVRSLTCPELYGDERDQIVGKLNQVAAALGVGNGFYKDGQSVSYSTEGPFHRLKAVGYNLVSEHSDSDGIATLTMKSPISELNSSAQKQKLIDTLFAILGANPNMQIQILNIKPLPGNSSAANIYVMDKVGRSRVSSFTVVQALNEKKSQLESQLKVEKVISNCGMDKYLRERYIRDPPAGYDDATWRQANLENPCPAKMLPQPIRGFEQLQNRQLAQQSEVENHNICVKDLLQRVTNVDKSAETSSIRISVLKNKERQLSHRLLKVLCMQLIQQKYGFGIDSTEEQIQCALESLNAKLNGPQQVKSRISELMTRISEESSEIIRNTLESNSTGTISEADVNQLFKYMSRCQDGLESLATVAKNNLRQLNSISTAMDL